MRGVVVLALLSVGCGSAGAISTQASAITESTASADARVVALTRTDGSLVCSGVIVAPHVVLTAGHCGTRAELRQLNVNDGAVRDAIVHPTADLAAVITASAATPIAELGTVPSVGSELLLVGFGATAADGGTSGERREGRARVASVTESEFVASGDPSLTCAGDSGGAAFAGTKLVGVTSRGDAACTARSVFTRVDALSTFIDDVIAANAPGAAAPGERCHSDEHCAAGSCVAAPDEPAIHYCAPPCPCTQPLVCVAGRCEHSQPTPGAVGSPCSSECVVGECRAVDGGPPICTRRCLPDVGCGAGLECVNEGGATYYCVRARPTPPESDGGCRAGRGSRYEWLALVALMSLIRRDVRRG